MTMASRHATRRANVVAINVVTRRKKGSARIHQVKAPLRLKSCVEDEATTSLEPRDVTDDPDHSHFHCRFPRRRAE